MRARSVDPRVICIVAVLLSAATHSATAQIASVRFPGLLESYFTNAVKLSTVERQRLIKGEPLTKMLEADEAKEVAVFGAVWISAPIRRYVEAVKDIETFERGGGFRVTKRISAQPRLEDFSELRLPTGRLGRSAQLPRRRLRREARRASDQTSFDPRSTGRLRMLEPRPIA